MLGIKVAASTRWQILKDAGIERATTIWGAFPRDQDWAILACDVVETVTLNGQRPYVAAVATAVRYLIRDRDATFPDLFDEVLANAGIAVVLTGLRILRTNAITQRRVRTDCTETAEPNLDREPLASAARPTRA